MNETNFLPLKDYTSQKELYMTFNLSEKVYAIPARQIIEIIQLPALYIPEKLPDHIIGLLNLRGKIISIIDLRKFLGIAPSFYSVEDQILIIEIKGKTFGVIINYVYDVIQFNKEELEFLPYRSFEKFISGIYKSKDYLAAIINLELIFNNIEAIEIEEYDYKAFENSVANYFPQDKISIEKLKKRALNLQNELKLGLDKNNYHDNNFVSFSLSGENHCLSLKFVKEFCKLKIVNLVPIPCTPEFILGIINLRGDFITIVDIKNFLQVPKSDITDKTKIIVLRSQKYQIGLLVDEVFNIINIPGEKLVYNNPPIFDKNKFTTGEVLINEKSIMTIIDIEKFLKDERIIVEDAI